MTQYDNRNGFVLFKNDKEGNEARPDYTGLLTDETGKEWRIAAWIKDGQKGKFMAGKISEKISSGQSSQTPANRGQSSQPAAPPVTDSFEDSIPF